MAENQKITLKTGFNWFFIAGFFLILLQLVNVIPPWFTPMDWGKAIVFRIILSILIFFFVFQIIFRKIPVSDLKEKIRPISLLFWMLISFSLICLLSTIFSNDPHFSLWGDPVRNGGFVNFIFFVIYALLSFFVFQKNDWEKIFNFLIFVSLIISAVAVLQRLSLFSNILIPFNDRPVSTIGNPILLATYLLLVTFITFCFGIKAKNNYGKIYYFSSAFIFFLVTVFLSETRGAILGLFFGILWVLFAYPNPKFKKIKIYGLIFLSLMIVISFSLKVYLDSHVYVYQKIPPIISKALDRTLSIYEGTKIISSRISAWRVSSRALMDRPVLGYGPENFMIAFAKHYDPSLPQIGPDEYGVTQAEWWDRAHNFLFDIALSTGIPSLVIYLLFFIVLLWQLQKSKKRDAENAVLLNGLQATFIAYLIALFFSFDSVSTYLASFLLIGYSFHLLSNNYLNPEKSSFSKTENIINRLYPYRIPIISLLFLVLVFFIYIYNIKPLNLNKNVNESELFARSSMCPNALEILNKISPQIRGSIIDNHLSTKLIIIIYGCVRESQNKDITLIDQAIQTAKKTTNSHSAYIQNWLQLGEFNTILIEQKNKLTNNVFAPSEEMNKLKDETNYYFERAHELSPKRQMVLKEWSKAKIVTSDYRGAEEKASECLDLNQNYLSCIWEMALIKGYEKDKSGFDYYYNLSKEMGYLIESEESLKQLVDMFIQNNDYASLVAPYKKLIEITKDSQQKAQLHAALAATYVELKQFSNAKKEAQKIFELIQFFPLAEQAQVKTETESFIKNLGQ